MSDSDLVIKTSASAATFIEALRIVRHQLCQLNMLMAQTQPIKDTPEEEEAEL